MRLHGHVFGKHVGDVIPRVTVQTLLQPLLVKIMANKTHAPTEDKDSIQCTYLHKLICLISCEAATRPEKIHKRNTNETVNIENEVWFLGCGDLLYI